jgi:hypothetical protein
MQAKQGCTRLHKAAQGDTRLHKVGNFPVSLVFALCHQGN